MKGRKHFLSRQEGTTLVETMMALGLLGLSAIAFMNFMSVTVQSAQRQTHSLKASQILESNVEGLISTDGSNGSLNSGTYTRLFDKDGNLVTSQEVFTLDYTVTPNTPVPDVLTIQASIRWNDGFVGQTRALSVTRPVPPLSIDRTQAQYIPPTGGPGSGPVGPALPSPPPIPSEQTW